MEPELIEQLITNLPNFIGFTVLAVIQWRIYQKTVEMLDECLESRK